MPTWCPVHVRVWWLMQAPTPWTTEHCVALARCMSRMAQLQDALPDQLQFKQVSTVRSYYKPYIIRAVSICTLSSHLRCSCACFCHVPPTQDRLCRSMSCLYVLLQWPLHSSRHCTGSSVRNACELVSDLLQVCSLKLKLCEWYFSCCLS